MGKIASEIKVGLEHLKQGDVLYNSKQNYKIQIIKFRIADWNTNSGKSGGWRIIGLVDILNSIFFLLSMYKHSSGKANISKSESNKVKNLCDEYSMNI